MSVMHDVFTILLCDDEPSIRNGINNIITREFNYEVETILASNGEEAWTLFISKKPDLVISDIVMPLKTGLQLVMDIRREGYDTPVILLSGYDDFSYAQQAIKLKVATYLTKPIRKNELIAEIRATMQESSEKRNLRLVDYNRFVESARILFLRRLLLGEIKSQEEIERSCTNLGLYIDSSHFTVLLVKCHEHIIELLLDTISREFGENYRYMEIGGNRLLISRYDEKHTRHDMMLILDILEDYDIHIIQGRTTGEDLRNLAISYKTALLASSYSIYAPNARYIDQNIITEAVPEKSASDIDTESLKDYLLIGTDNEIRLWVDTFFDRLFYVPTPPPSYLKGMSLYLLNDVERVLVNTSNIDKSLLPKLDPAELNEIASVEQLKFMLLSALLHIRHEVIPHSLISNDTVIYKAKKYIDDHIRDNINLNDIAEYLNMNPTYFSSYFKLKTGENFRTYLAGKKNSYAKSLLSDPELTIDEIAQKLGYADYRSFHRIFKNLNGMTPTEFRKHMKGEVR